MENAALVVALGGLLLNLLVTVVGGVWKLSRMELALREALTESAKENRKALEDSTKEIDDRIDKHVRYFGETVAAVRQKITDVEIFARDTFIRKDEMHSQLQLLNEKLDKLK